MMKIDTKLSKSILLVSLSGKFNIEEVARFEEDLTGNMTKNITTIIIDFSEVEYIDSSALGSLIKLMNKAKNLNIDFILFDMTPPILSIFRLAYLDKFFSITTGAELSKKYPDLSI